MKQLNLPRKQIALVQALVSLALLVLTLVFSFTSIMSIDLSDSDFRKSVQASLDSMSKDVEGLDSIEFPEKLDVSMPKLIKADILMFKIIKVSINAAKEATSTLSKQDQEKIDQAKEDLQKAMEDPKGQEAILTVFAALGQAVDLSGNENEKSESGAGEIIMNVIRVIAMCYILIFITVFPIVVAITTLITLIKVLSHLGNPEEVSGKTAGKVISYLATVVTFALALTLFNGMGFGTGLTMIMVLALLSVLVNVVASRLRSYSDRDFRYINVAQGTAAVAGVGAIVFFVNLLNVNVLRTFFNSFGDYMEKLGKQVESINASIDMYNQFVPASQRVSNFSASAGWVADLLIIAVFGITALAMTGSLIVSCAAQLGLTVSKKTQKGTFIFSGVSAIICTALPFIVSMLKNQKYYSMDMSGSKIVINEEIEGAIYSIPAETKSALIGMLIGAIIILAAGIASSVLKKKFCADLPEEWEMLILNGKAPLPGTEEATATATVAASATVETNENNENNGEA